MTSAVATQTASNETVTPEESAAQVFIPQLRTRKMIVPIVGITPLIIHRFSEKAKRIMLANMQGKSLPKEPKNPEQEYKDALYRFRDGGYGFPCIGFKAATISGCRFYGRAITMTAVKQFLFFNGEVGVDGQQLARIEGEPQLREDVVRVNRGGADLRYRPMFPDWRTELHVTYVAGSIDKESVLALIDAGGMGVGVGEWRPEKDGDFGMYQIDTSLPVEDKE